MGIPHFAYILPRLPFSQDSQGFMGGRRRLSGTLRGLVVDSRERASNGELRLQYPMLGFTV